MFDHCDECINLNKDICNTCNEDNFLFKRKEDIDPHTIIECYKILVDKLKETISLHEKILKEKEKTIDILKETISLLEERDKLKDERIDILTKKLMIGKEAENGISSESS